MKTKPCWSIGLCLLIWLVMDALGQDLPGITLPRLISTILVYDIELELTQLAQEHAQQIVVTPMEEDPPIPLLTQINHMDPARLQRPTPDSIPDWAVAHFLDLPRAH